MATSKHLLGLLRSHIKGDNDEFLSVALQAAAHEARNGHRKLAEELKNLVDEAKSEVNRTNEKVIPLARPHGELAELISVSYPSINLGSMVLQDECKSVLHRIIQEQRQGSILRGYGLHPIRKILLVGPPGSGKTMTASTLASELRLPLFNILVDRVITRYMGETASKLRLVFEAINSTRGVYFFDEFDAIGSHRASSNDVGEIRRVLNSFLQFLEEDQSSSLIVAATNHPELLDFALFRRFDEVIRYSFPDISAIEQILRNRLAIFETNDMDWVVVSSHASGLSQSDIVSAADDAIKISVLTGLEQISTDQLLKSINNRKNFQFQVEKK